MIYEIYFLKKKGDISLAKEFFFQCFRSLLRARNSNTNDTIVSYFSLESHETDFL